MHILIYLRTFLEGQPLQSSPRRVCIWSVFSQHALGPNCTSVGSRTAQRLVRMSFDVTPGVPVTVQAVVTDESEHAVDAIEGANDDKVAETWVSLKFTHAGREYTLDLADSDRFAVLVWNVGTRD
jgi:hypothetical protein